MILKSLLLQANFFALYLPKSIEMRKYMALAVLLFLSVACAQTLTEIEKTERFQKTLNKEFADKATSPLPADALKKFKGLDMYPVNERFIIEATLVETPNEEPFKMLTTTDRKPTYRKYGELHFSLNGKDLQLSVYQDLALIAKEEFKKHLFIPFTDLTSGVSTYGGGRYIDMEIPEGDTVVLNFNLAYNPYCVYNPKYSCPIPPEENFLNTEIHAGVKDYKYE